MKKKVLSTTIALLFAFSSSVTFAEDGDNWEKELDKISKNFESQEIKLSDISSFLSDSVTSDESIKPTEVTESIANNEKSVSFNVSNVKVETKPLKKEVAIKKELEMKKEVEVKKVEPSEVTVKTSSIKENDDLVETLKVPVLSAEALVDETDFIFLRNIPEGTRFTIKENYTVLPNKKFIIFSGGERVLKTPQTIENPDAKFCFIELVNSGSARILKNNKSFVVTGNNTEVKEYKLTKSYGEYILRTYQTIFSIDNKNIKNLTCYLSETYQKGVDEVPQPITIKDMKDATGGIFKVDFPAYEEI